MTRGLGFLLFATLGASTVAHAAQPTEEHGGACTTAAAIPADLTGWSAAHGKAMAAAKVGAIASKALLVQGVAAEVTLLPASRVVYTVEPRKPAKGDNYGGLLAFDVARPGRYRIAQSGRSWVEVIVDGEAVASVGHGHGPDCSGIAKMVDYDLPVGRHFLQIAGNGEARVTVMVAPVR
ncbi:hypothetical protein [Novosphingobium gossypii]|uniref:hypothetical protein n=1 Tax=Novosphingobium gossypii TaxID=1604774 RepID=UPI003D1AECA1